MTATGPATRMTIADWVAEQLDTAPPLSDDQLARIARALRPAAPVADAA